MLDWTERTSRAHFADFRKIQTRWQDNDVYGHVNNVNYYSYFDTSVAGWLIEQNIVALGRPEHGAFIVAETACQYRASVAYPDALEIGLVVARVGNSSITYNLGVFIVGEASARAVGRFVHVHVDTHALRPKRLTDAVRTKFEALRIENC